MLAQNGFAVSDAAYDVVLSKSKGWFKEVLKCEMQAANHCTDGKVESCLKAIELIEKSPNKKNWLNKQEKKYLGESYLNAGILYYYTPNYTKSYQYLKKAATLGNTNAEKGLDILCRNHSWVCK
jgi:TPR repeat protein